MTSIYSEKHPLSAFFMKAAALLLMLVIASCAPRYTTHGHQIDPFELEQITIGTSTIQDVRDVLGQPSFTGAFNENKLFYVSQHMREPVAGKKPASASSHWMRLPRHRVMVLVWLSRSSPTSGGAISLVNRYR